MVVKLKIEKHVMFSKPWGHVQEFCHGHVYQKAVLKEAKKLPQRVEAIEIKSIYCNHLTRTIFDVFWSTIKAICGLVYVLVSTVAYFHVRNVFSRRRKPCNFLLIKISILLFFARIYHARKVRWCGEHCEDIYIHSMMQSTKLEAYTYKLPCILIKDSNEVRILKSNLICTQERSSLFRDRIFCFPSSTFLR